MCAPSHGVMGTFLSPRRPVFLFFFKCIQTPSCYTGCTLHPVRLCVITQTNICQTTAASHLHHKHTCFLLQKKKKKKRGTNAPTERAIVQGHVSCMQNKPPPTDEHRDEAAVFWRGTHTHTHTHTHTKNSSFQMPGRKISGYKDASGSSSCQNTDSGFVLCCLDLTRQNKWETCPPPQKKCIAKRWSEQSFMPICLKTSTRCNLSFSVCVCEWMWVGVCPCLCVCIFLHVSSDDFSSTSKPLCIFCVYPGVCAVYDT